MVAHESAEVGNGPASSFQDPQQLIGLLQNELTTTNHEVMLLTLELEQRVAERMAQLSQINEKLMKEVIERRRAEELVIRLNRDLELRAQLLQDANEELEAFSYSVSHDLRAPLHHILVFASMLEEGAGAVLDAKSHEILDRIKLSAVAMSSLIDELLRFSRFSHTELRRENADLNAVVEEVMADLEPDIKGRSIKWKRSRLPAASCDIALLKQVFANLVSNAIKYTRRCSTAEIEIGFLGQDSVETTYFVRDNGAGFDPQDAGRLFGVFQRLHKKEDFEGVGIGLTNVRRIITRHGGRVWAEGQPGEGATFYFTLPKKPPCNSN